MFIERALAVVCPTVEVPRVLDSLSVAGFHSYEQKEGLSKSILFVRPNTDKFQLVRSKLAKAYSIKNG